MTKQQLDSFLAELTELSARHGIYIRGCGCCGSPRLTDKDQLVAWGGKIMPYKVEFSEGAGERLECLVDEWAPSTD